MYSLYTPGIPNLCSRHTPQLTMCYCLARGAHVFYSPNFVWLSIAVVYYKMAPYDLRVARDVLTPEFLVWGVKRLILNLLVSGIYTGFWSVAIYVWSWSQRKFRRSSWPSLATYAHNMWYFFLGIAQWTLWECAFVHLWASDKLPFLSDDKAFATPSNAARMILWTFGIPIWRGIHFYFSHRFIHMRCLYKYVHSLHHRFV